MRKNLYELLEKRKFDVSEEYRILWRLFAEEECSGYDYPITLLQQIDDEYFRNFEFRASYTDIRTMMNDLGFQPYIRADIDTLLCFCEFLLAVLAEFDSMDAAIFEEQCRTILDNIGYILRSTNHEIVLDHQGRKIIVETNPQATLAAELITDGTTAMSIIEYNHFAMKGHIAEKKQILLSIGNYIEPFLRDRKLNIPEYGKLKNDISFMLNNFDIRHNNRSGKNAKEYIANIPDDELEIWYDKAYQLMISVINLADCQQIKKDIELVKNNWR